MSPSDYRVLHDAQRAVLFALMEKRHEPFTAKEILEACGLAVRYEPDDGVRLESDTAPGPDWGHLDDPFLRGGKQRHENGKGAE